MVSAIGLSKNVAVLEKSYDINLTFTGNAYAVALNYKITVTKVVTSDKNDTCHSFEICNCTQTCNYTLKLYLSLRNVLFSSCYLDLYVTHTCTCHPEMFVPLPKSVWPKTCKFETIKLKYF